VCVDFGMAVASLILSAYGAYKASQNSGTPSGGTPSGSQPTMKFFGVDSLEYNGVKYYGIDSIYMPFYLAI
jgi:hypothetical protein